MEANEITEEPQATMDSKEHPSSKDLSSTEDLQAPAISEIPLESSISETVLQPSTSEALWEPPTSISPETQASEGLEISVSETPVESHTSETLSVPSQVSIKSHTPESLSKSPQSVTSLEKAISEIPVEAPTAETYISQVPEKYQLVQVNDSSVSPHELSSNEVPQTPVPELEDLPKHSFAEPSTQVHMDTSEKPEEVAEEDKQKADTSDITAHTVQPEPRPGKKKEKRVSRYTSRPVVPAKRPELLEVVKAMHRDQFDAQVNNLFQWEKNAALRAIQTGVYVGWRCPHYLWDCFRIGDDSKCFCGHLLKEHQIISDISVPCGVSQCRCLMFCFIPSRPEEVGEFWLKRRATFDPKAWRAQCRCKHNHEEHAATGSHPCRHRGCFCNCFESNFLCAACDRRWEEHETFFETEETRRRGGRPHGTYNVNNWPRPF